MQNRRELVWGIGTATAVMIAGSTVLGCGAGQAAAPPPTPTAQATPPSEFQVRVQMIPQEARLGQDENVVVRATFLRTAGGQTRGVSGAQIVAVANYPSGPQTFTSDVTTFSDGRAPDLNIPVAPAQRGSNVRVEVTMKFQGREYKQVSGFTVR
ncbi:MAG TPA: hypothetical protein VHS99_06410 [Chloroflexota bacterium]|jgi:hypothetical protein|nr:hypothetical protein [Chloroflexota bacterium]